MIIKSVEYYALVSAYRVFSGGSLPSISLFFSAVKALVKTIDTTTGIDHFLLARIEGVTGRTNVKVNVFCEG